MASFINYQSVRRSTQRSLHVPRRKQSNITALQMWTHSSGLWWVCAVCFQLKYIREQCESHLETVKSLECTDVTQYCPVQETNPSLHCCKDVSFIKTVPTHIQTFRSQRIQLSLNQSTSCPCISTALSECMCLSVCVCVCVCVCERVSVSLSAQLHKQVCVFLIKTPKWNTVLTGQHFHLNPPAGNHPGTKSSLQDNNCDEKLLFSIYTQTHMRVRTNTHTHTHTLTHCRGGNELCFSAEFDMSRKERN